MDDLKLKYSHHKAGAKQRGIEFNLTFEEWKDIWSEHIANRGRGSSQMGMCRTRDEGGYTKENVRIATVKENAQERSVVASVKSSQSRYSKNEDFRKKPPSSTSWLWRGDVFKEYSEDDEDFA